MSLAQLFHKAKNTPSDINQHLDYLFELASTCSHITEFGSRHGNSTIALLMGQPKKFVCYDIEMQPEIFEIFKHKGQTQFVIYQDSTLTIDPIEETDLLFIDTEHNYDQLIAELRIHADKAKKYIVLHDTETYMHVGDPPTKAGLKKAIDEFLASNPNWSVHNHRAHNNGLTTLIRT